jgi:dihydrofolate synthase / folylpolyglutamate synthase
MTYQEAYEYFDSLHNLPRQYNGKGNWQNSPTILRSVRLMLKMAGNPELKIPHYIHVTGTSGKGSVSMMLSEILKAQGFKVGLITSPHPTKITERWQINSQSMPDKDFTEMVADLKPVWDEYIHSANYTFPSMVSLNTIIALYYFAKHKVDFAILEVACGGKNDGTNVIPHKDVAIITNIGLDHISILGNTKEMIAENKSGIITKGCNVITAERDPKIIKLLEIAAKKKRALSFEGVETDRYGDHKDKNIKQDWSGTDFKIDGISYHLNNLGYHQIANAKVAIVAAKKLGINDKTIQAGLAATEFPIRFEVVSSKPYVILDGAHNADKVKATVLGVKNLQKKYKDLHLLIGFSDNKDHATFLKELLTLKPKSLACTRFTKNIFRKTADPKKLMNTALKINPRLKVSAFLDPEAALAWSQKQAGNDDLTLVTGSMFLSGELRPHFKKIK